MKAINFHYFKTTYPIGRYSVLDDIQFSVMVARFCAKLKTNNYKPNQKPGV